MPHGLMDDYASAKRIDRKKKYVNNLCMVLEGYFVNLGGTHER